MHTGPRSNRNLRADCRAAVSIVFAVCLLPLLIAISAAIDFSRLVDSRAALQRAVDNAALSGAAAYSVNADAASKKAVVSATAVFCQMSAKMPAGSAVTGTGNGSCPGVAGGPTVTAQVGGFVAGIPGIAPSGCSATAPVVSGVTCGFIVSVSASATLATILPTILGATRTVTAAGIAANPFINIGSAMTAQVYGTPWNNNSIWVYPLLLNANGDPDFAANPGAIPGLPTGFFPADASASGCVSLTSCGSTGTPAGANCASLNGCLQNPVAPGCTDNPNQFVCGSFTMLATTYYNSQCPVSLPCYPNGGPGTYPKIINGIVQNPLPPPSIVTATTPLGIAFESIAGAGIFDGYTYGPAQAANPSTYGYQANKAPNGSQQQACYYPGNALYTTVAQEFQNTLNTYPAQNALDWPKVTHWFYSSYLMNGLPPSEGEILSQLNALTTPNGYGPSKQYNTRIPLIGQDTTGSFVPPLNTCANNPAYDEYLLTAYPTTGATNGSLFILQQPAQSQFIPASSTGYVGRYFTPADTPGNQYAALSCQAYGSNQFTFYWNDMGGPNANSLAYGGGDNLNYQDGTVTVACSGTSFVLLIG